MALIIISPPRPVFPGLATRHARDCANWRFLVRLTEASNSRLGIATPLTDARESGESTGKGGYFCRRRKKRGLHGKRSCQKVAASGGVMMRGLRMAAHLRGPWQVPLLQFSRRDVAPHVDQPRVLHPYQVSALLRLLSSPRPAPKPPFPLRKVCEVLPLRSPGGHPRCCGGRPCRRCHP